MTIEAGDIFDKPHFGSDLYKIISEHIGHITPEYDIATDKDKNLLVDVYLPGIEKQNIDVTVSKNYVQIIADSTDEINPDTEFIIKNINRGNFKIILEVDEEYRKGDITSKYKNGILSLIIKPKEPKIKKVEVK